MDRLVIRMCYREKFRQLHTERDRQIGVLADDASVFDRQERELALQGRSFHYIAHDRLF